MHDSRLYVRKIRDYIKIGNESDIEPKNHFMILYNLYGFHGLSSNFRCEYYLPARIRGRR